MTTDFVASAGHADSPPFSLIEQKSLLSRLIQALGGAARELVRDPRSFTRDLFVADTKDAKRRQRIYFGLAVALITHVTLIAIIAVLGWRTMFVKPVETDREKIVTWVVEPPPLSREARAAPAGDKNSGGGGGGDHSPLPTTKGPLPQMSAAPQVVKPNSPSVKLPATQLPPTIVGPDSSPPPPGVALGVPAGVIAEAPSPGPGQGGGVGGDRGSGAGQGNGPGSGKGSDGATGNKGRPGLPNARDVVNGPIPYNLIRNFPDSTGIVWLHRPTPIVTPEAQANKVKGEVWLRATFRADGTISDIEVIREVPFMTESAIAALQHSRFRPATIKGKAITLLNVPVRINVDIVQR